MPTEKPFLSQSLKSRLQLWPPVFYFLILFSYAYLLFEWSFYVTQASISFMYRVSLLEKIEIFFICSLVAAALMVIVNLVFALLDLAVSAIFPKLRSVFLVLPVSLLFTLLAVTLFDHFTYTVFHFGLSTASEIGQVGYLLVYLAAGFFVTRWLIKKVESIKPAIVKTDAFISLGLILISLVAAGHNYFSNPAEIGSAATTVKAPNKSLPNIIVLGTDGLSANSMSLYGASRETTPFLNELAKTSLLSENNFTNAGFSMGSDVATLTSKSPLETKVLYPPDILSGADVDESLPNILHQLGYKTVQLAVPHYADSDTANIEGAFDEVNCTSNSQFLYHVNKFFGFSFNNSFYLLNSIIDQAKSRLLEIFLIERMNNPIAEIQSLASYPASDKERISCLFNYLDEAKATNTPLFAHLHMLTTHGSLFYSDSKEFSGNLVQSKNWMPEFYADSIVDYDNYVKQVVDYLKQIGEYDNTIIVIYTDHGEQWTTDGRIPLMFHFPNDEHAGTITVDTQNMDMAPTLLDYMGVGIPSWMEGQSLLQPVPNDRLIVTTYTKNLQGDDSGLYGLDTSFIYPPFYQFNVIRVIQCQMITTFDTEEQKVYRATVTNYVGPCDTAKLDDQDTIKQKLTQILTGYGFDLPTNW